MAKYDKTKHILDRIGYYCSEIAIAVSRFGDSPTAFHEDFAYRNTCSMSLIQIGELAMRLPQEFQDRYSYIPWKQIKGMRNWFVHDYESMSESRIWETIKTDIPDLQRKFKEILRLEGYEEGV
jgi:uncharacterized protein with HEPN domain